MNILLKRSAFALLFCITAGARPRPTRLVSFKMSETRSAPLRVCEDLREDNILPYSMD